MTLSPDICIKSPKGEHRKVKKPVCVYCGQKMKIVEKQVWRLHKVRQWVIVK